MPIFKSTRSSSEKENSGAKHSNVKSNGKSVPPPPPAQEKAGAFIFNLRPPSPIAQLLPLQNISFLSRANSTASGASSAASSTHSRQKSNRSPSPHSPSTPASRAEALLNGLARLTGHQSTDPEIAAARQKVLDAQRAEEAAEKARLQATNLVKEAKLEVERLEREASANANRAKVKQAQLKVVSDSAKSLGRRR